jgi:hypothetical protein
MSYLSRSWRAHDLLHSICGENLGRAECRDTHRFQTIDVTCLERLLRTDDDEVGSQLEAETLQIVRLDPRVSTTRTSTHLSTRPRIHSSKEGDNSGREGLALQAMASVRASLPTTRMRLRPWTVVSARS